MAPDNTKLEIPYSIKGVRIACAGKRKTGVDQMATYDIPLDHDVLTVGALCPISELVGIPFFVCRLRPPVQDTVDRHNQGNKSRRSNPTNKIVKKLMISCSAMSSSESNGEEALLEKPKRWTKNVGDVILARKDHKPLYPHHVRVLLRFMRDVDIPPETLDDLEIVALFNPGDFKDFYMEQRQDWEQDSDLVYLLDLPSPWTPGSDAATRCYRKLDEDIVEQFKPPAPANATKKDRILWTRRNLDRKAYRESSEVPLKQRLRDAESWRERHLLMENAILKARLDSGEEPSYLEA